MCKTASGSSMYDSVTQSQCSVTTERGGMGREVERGFKREGTYIGLMLIHVAIRRNHHNIVK